MTIEEERLIAAIREAIHKTAVGYEAIVDESVVPDTLGVFTITSANPSSATLRAVITSPSQMQVEIGDHGARFRSLGGHPHIMRAVLPALFAGRVETAERMNKTVYFMDGDRWRLLGRLPLGRRARRRRRMYEPYPRAAGGGSEPASGPLCRLPA